MRSKRSRITATAGFDHAWHQGNIKDHLIQCKSHPSRTRMPSQDADDWPNPGEEAYCRVTALVVSALVGLDIDSHDGVVVSDREMRYAKPAESQGDTCLKVVTITE